jgi:protein Mpv17
MCRNSRVLPFVLVSLASALAFSPNVYSTSVTKRKTTSPNLNIAAFRTHRPCSSTNTIPRWVANAPHPLDEASMSMNEAASYTFPESMISSEIMMEKIINGAFLAVCFGFAAYAIFNIDHGMTRGWTQSEIAMRIPLDNWSSYEAALNEKPIMTKTFINVVIYLLGDWLSQTVFAKKHVLDFDLQRTLRNGFIGLCFGPLVHQYYEFSDSILPVEGGLANRFAKICMDQTIYLTVKCSIYISAVGLLGGEDWATAQQNVKERIGPVVLTAWKFWPLVHCITYGLIPARHRILWVNCVDLVWNAILASKARGDDDSPSIPHCEEDEHLIESALMDSKELMEIQELALTLPSMESSPDHTWAEPQFLVLDSEEKPVEPLDEIVMIDRPSNTSLSNATGILQAT